MTTRATRKARAKANARRRGEERQQAGEVIHLKDAARPGGAENTERTGLAWLLHKKRITPAQGRAGLRYGMDYRDAQVAGLEPIRSALNDTPPGGDGVPGFSRAEVDITAKSALDAARLALSFHTEMTLVCDAICGQQLTPRQFMPVRADYERAEQTLRIALDLLVVHYRLVGERQIAPLTNCAKRA